MAYQVRRRELGCWGGGHVPPVPENRGAITQGENFLEAMADEQDGHAPVARMAHDCE
jgi:hypothetical protein